MNDFDRMWAEADPASRDRFLATLAKAAAAADDAEDRRRSREARLEAARTVVELMVWGFLIVGWGIATGWLN